MSWCSLSRSTRIHQAGALLLCISLFAAACGGGSDGDSTETADADPETTETSEPDDAEPDATATPLIVPTATPLPTATALPTSTPVPLEEPTPSSVLLTTAFTNSSKVTTVGIDEVFFGMTAEEAAEAASTEWIGDPSTTSNCYLVTPSNGPEGVTLWVVDGRIERLDIEHPDIRTPSKLGIGNTLAELRSQLGERLTSETGGDGGVVATFTPTDPGDREFRIIFELAEDKVVRYRSGRVGVIQRAPEGC